MKKSVVIESILITILVLFSIYMWSLPIMNNQMPYGEVDAAHHYGITSYMFATDTIGPLYKPTFLYRLYGHRSLAGAGNFGIESPYAPNFFLNQAIAQIISGNEPVGYYLFLSVLCVMIVLTSYFLIRKLFGIIPAFLSSLLIMVSKIDIITFIMGQYVILVSFACLPLILYCYYKYTSSFLENKPRQIYLYIMALLIVTQYYNHFQSLIDTFMILLIFSILLLIKERKIPFKLKHATIAAVVFLVLISPFLHNSLQSVKDVKGFGDVDNEVVPRRFTDLFKWYGESYYTIPTNTSHFSYKEMHGYWTLPLLFIGFLILLLRRQRKDLLLLSWLIGLYFILHLDFFIGWMVPRLYRSVNDVPYIFYPLVAIGLIGLLSFIKVPFRIKKYLTYAFVGIFLLLFINVNFISSYQILNQGYAPPYSINQYQYDAAMWLRDNVQEDVYIYNKGTLVMKTKRFINAVSHRLGETQEELYSLKYYYKDESFAASYYFIDYSEFSGLGMNKEVEELQQWETENLKDFSLVYSNQFVRVYDVR
jgi:hypothetical protein